ncbi:MAG: CoA transferase [Alphaproteobacteria bacterium]|nr:MAG: CoA transferase [Alphaproteobacteria bacterium]
MSETPNNGPLKGLKILDLTSVLLGPYATQVLGDLGAEVIKVENPTGDILRWGGPGRSRDMGPIFLNVNRNKRSLTLDLKTEEARDILKKMVETADVFIHNIRENAIQKLGFDYEAVKAIRPDIVYVHAVGFSKDGAYGGRQAYDDLVQAASGTTHFQSLVDGDPTPRYVPALLADKTTGLHAVYATLAALFHRERTGEGQFVEVPMLESFVSFSFAEHLYGHTFVPPTGQMGYKRVMNPNRKPYQTKDGYISIVPYDDRQWEEFFRIGDRLEVYDDPRFSTYQARTENSEDLYGIIAEVALTKTTNEWLEALDAARVPAMRANDFDTLMKDPHLVSVDFFEEHDHPTEGRYIQMKAPINFEKSPSSLRRHPPHLGEDSDSVLRDYGYSEEEITVLREAGALGKT